MSYETRVKALIGEATFSAMADMEAKIGTPMPHGDSVDEFLGHVANEVYDAIWEYIKEEY